MIFYALQSQKNTTFFQVIIIKNKKNTRKINNMFFSQVFSFLFYCPALLVAFEELVQEFYSHLSCFLEFELLWWEFKLFSPLEHISPFHKFLTYFIQLPLIRF